MAASESARYADLMAQRVRNMTSSAMRDLMAIVEHRDVISLAGGLPDTSIFPPEVYTEIQEKIAEFHCASALQYGTTEGLKQTRVCIASLMEPYAGRVDPDQILVTTGAQQALDLLCKTTIDPGDIIIAEGPTYPGAVPTFRSYQAEVVHIPIDENGMRTEDLTETLKHLADRKQKPKLIYTIPNFQNPAGVTLSLQRRQQLVAIAKEWEILLIEDDPYGSVWFDTPPPKALYGMADNQFVVYVGTFSKILAPGLRLGWISGPQPLIERLNIAKQGVDLCSSPMNQYFAIEYFSDKKRYQNHLNTIRSLYRKRRDQMLASLQHHFADLNAKWTHPGGGLFIWLELPEYLHTSDLLAQALQHGVAFVPGSAAFLDGRGASAMRLNFSAVTCEQIDQGINKIATVVKKQEQLYQHLAHLKTQPAKER